MSAACCSGRAGERAAQALSSVRALSGLACPSARIASVSATTGLLLDLALLAVHAGRPFQSRICPDCLNKHADDDGVHTSRSLFSVSCSLFVPFRFGGLFSRSGSGGGPPSRSAFGAQVSRLRICEAPLQCARRSRTENP